MVPLLRILSPAKQAFPTICCLASVTDVPGDLGGAGAFWCLGFSSSVILMTNLYYCLTLRFSYLVQEFLKKEAHMELFQNHHSVQGWLH